MSIALTHPRYKEVYQEVEALCDKHNLMWRYKPKRLTALGAKIEFRCMKCLSLFTKTPERLRNKNSGPIPEPCPKCSRKIQDKMSSARNMGKKPANTYPLSYIKKILAARGYRLVQRTLEPNGSISCTAAKMKVQSLTTGKYRITSFNNIRKYAKSPEEAGRAKKTPKRYNQELKELGSPFRVSEYIGAHHKVEHTCTLCGFSLMWMPTTFLRNKKRYAYCPSCSPAPHSAIKLFQVVKKGREYKFRLRGYEYLTLKELLSEGHHPKDIRADLNGDAPAFKSLFQGHRPDFYLPKIKTFVETKSLYTLGVARAAENEESFNKVRRKAVMMLEAGFAYELRVYDDRQQRVFLPKKWWKRTFSYIRSYLEGRKRTVSPRIRS